MAFAHEVVRVTLTGTMFDGSEVWTTGFYLGKKNENAEDPTQAAADAIRDLWSTYFTSTNSRTNNTYTFASVKLAMLDQNENTVLDKVVYSNMATPSVGGTSLNRLPPQCSVAATLTSDRVRGKASKGRMYLPGASLTVGVDGKITLTDQTAIANQLEIFLEGVNGHLDVPDNIILAAKGEGPFGVLAAQNDWVTGLRIGDVMDTQRRRRNGLVESYLVRPIAA